MTRLWPPVDQSWNASQLNPVSGYSISGGTILLRAGFVHIGLQVKKASANAPARFEKFLNLPAGAVPIRTVLAGLARHTSGTTMSVEANSSGMQIDETLHDEGVAWAANSLFSVSGSYSIF